MDDFDLVKNQMVLLKDQITILIDEIAKLNPAFIAFDIQKITKEEEAKCIHQGIDHLKVTPLDQWHHLHKTLNAYSDFYKDFSLSTQYVHRIPGVVVITQNQTFINTLVDNVNDAKDEIARIVRQNRESKQRHEFIHKAFKGIMTEQLYRKIHYVIEPVKNVWFNWASRPVPRIMSIEQAKKYVEDKKDAIPLWCDQEDWERLIKAAINDIESGRFEVIQKLKEFKSFPTIEFVKSDGKRKRHNATIPFLLFAQQENTLPKLSLLDDYDSSKNKTNAPYRATENKEMICAALGLIGVIKKHEKTKL
jgi:DNA replication terminus site-binding protein